MYAVIALVGLVMNSAPVSFVAVKISVLSTEQDKTLNAMEAKELIETISRDLKTIGIGVGYSNEIPEIKIEIEKLERSKFLALSPTFSISVSFKIISQGVTVGDSIKLNCEETSRFSIVYTPGQRAANARRKCIGKISASLTKYVSELRENNK